METLFVKNTIKDYNAKLFLTIHSGVYGLYIPFAFDKKECEDGDMMKAALNNIKNKYCSVCHVGAPSMLIGYQSSGTCVDYIYENYKVPYTLAWEIYTNEMRWEDLEKGAKEKVEDSLIKPAGAVNAKMSCFKFKEKLLRLTRKKNSKIKNKNKKSVGIDEKESCYGLFNPPDVNRFNWLIKNWTGALIEFLFYIDKNK